MKFLKSKLAWKRWVKRNGVCWVVPPKQFPCFAYETVTSFGYEETEANYLYDYDLERMLREVVQS